MTEYTFEKTTFQTINQGYNAVFKPNRLSLGVVIPIESYATSSVPTMRQHLERVQLVEALGFAAVWLRDVPFNVPSFGDAGQLFAPFVYLGFLAARTTKIALGVASIILPLRHPAHVAKAAASADVLSDGRLILGVASGDRPQEYPALNHTFENRGAQFRAAFDYIRHMADDTPVFDNPYGSLRGGLDMLPKPTTNKLPLLITGGSQQDNTWIAQHGDGWMLYPHHPSQQAQIIRDWQARVTAAARPPQPIMQPLYIDLADDPDSPAQAIHLGFRSGLNPLREYLNALQDIGVNHVALNLRFNQADTKATLVHLADALLPDFH
ncbi:MAG: LLM class oxidoreductase [Deinococcota bacterium]